jgi:hypothetical protein
VANRAAFKPNTGQLFVMINISMNCRQSLSLIQLTMVVKNKSRIFGFSLKGT